MLFAVVSSVLSEVFRGKLEYCQQGGGSGWLGTCAEGCPSFALISKHVAGFLLHSDPDPHLSDLCPSKLADLFCLGSLPNTWLAFKFICRQSLFSCRSNGEFSTHWGGEQKRASPLLEPPGGRPCIWSFRCSTSKRVGRVIVPIYQ